MGSRADRAVAYFKEGYNCSQSVFLAFADKYGIEQELAARLSSSFGAGIGRMREVCGAVNGMFMVVGLETGATVGADQAGKAANYGKVQEFASKVKEQTGGTIICRELLGLDKKAVDKESPIPEKRTEQYYKKRPCIEMIRMAAQLLEEEYGE